MVHETNQVVRTTLKRPSENTGIGGLQKAVGWVVLVVECAWGLSYVIGGCSVVAWQV